MTPHRAINIKLALFNAALMLFICFALGASFHLDAPDIETASPNTQDAIKTEAHHARLTRARAKKCGAGVEWIERQDGSVICQPPAARVALSEP